MSSDAYLSLEGDLMLDSSGDIALVDTPWRAMSQQAYIRLKTTIGDYLLYPGLGADLERLIGMPNTPETGEYGKNLIMSALKRESVLSSYGIDIKAIPVSYQSISFQIYITAGSRTELILTIEQNLGSEDAQGELEA